MQRPDRHYFHVTPARDLASIATRGLIPRIGLRSAAAGETQPRI